MPFYLRTGKRLPSERSQIVIQFSDVPHSIFGRPDDLIANRLIIRPAAGGGDRADADEQDARVCERHASCKPVALNLSLTDAFRSEAPRRRIAYERLLLDAINEQPDPVRAPRRGGGRLDLDRRASMEGWAHYGVKPSPYAAGSLGPVGRLCALTERNGHSWYE